jgi:hypothetical protein
VQRQQSLNQEGGSSINISNLSLPIQVFTYLFRPHVLEATGSVQLLVAIENLIHLGFFTQFIVLLLRGRISLRDLNWGAIMFVIVILLLLASTTSNLGIAVRQKWMVLPALYAIMFSHSARNTTRNPRRSGRGPSDQSPFEVMPHQAFPANSSHHQRQTWQRRSLHHGRD